MDKFMHEDEAWTTRGSGARWQVGNTENIVGQFLVRLVVVKTRYFL